MGPAATIAVTTRNRVEELEQLLPTALAQTADCEVLVIDDGSTDGTSDHVRRHFPEVRLERSEQSLGLIVQRTRAAQMARAPILVSVDDDARMPSTTTVEQTLADFDHPRIGAVAIPFVDVRTSTVVRQEAPDAEGRWITPSYIGTAHALRRDVFLGVGGYRSGLAQQAEEPDYCLRMLAAGYVVRLGRAEHVLHLESPKRDLARLYRLGARNEVLHGWHNVPFPYLPVRIAKVLAYQSYLAVFERRGLPVWRGIAEAVRAAWALRGDRRPVSRAAYRLDHDLRRRSPTRLEEIEHGLPPPLELSAHAPATVTNA
jgi:glycosyltransferase involved in cell wall biosynthesis